MKKDYEIGQTVQYLRQVFPDVWIDAIVIGISKWEVGVKTIEAQEVHWRPFKHIRPIEKEVQVVYQTESHGYTPKMVADEFARKFFDQPREVEEMKDDKFTLIDGRATYEVKLIKGQHLISSDVYQVVRL